MRGRCVVNFRQTPPRVSWIGPQGIFKFLKLALEDKKSVDPDLCSENYQVFPHSKFAVLTLEST